jgi:hypothetical protein
MLQTAEMQALDLQENTLAYLIERANGSGQIQASSRKKLNQAPNFRYWPVSFERVGRRPHRRTRLSHPAWRQLPAPRQQ